MHHLPVVLRIIDNTDIKTITKTDVERIIATINAKQYNEWTKHDKKLTLYKIVQYTKKGSCTKDTPIPSKVNRISLTVKEKDFKVTPENRLTQEDFAAIIEATTNGAHLTKKAQITPR